MGGLDPHATYDPERAGLPDCAACRVIGALCEHHLREECLRQREQIAALQRLLREAVPAIREAEWMARRVNETAPLPDDWHKRYEEVG